MELYQLSKYENIADRLKRLSSPHNHITTDPKLTIREKAKPFFEERKEFEQPRRSKYLQGTAYSKFSTLQAYKTEEQPSYTRIQHLNSPRQSKPTHNIETNIYKHTEPKAQLNEQAEEYREKNEKQVKEYKKTLEKAKSDSSYKIDQILQSFNNYKQNKERFLQNLNKQLPLVQIERIPEVESYPETKQSPFQRYPKQQGRLFMQIDNIWNSDEESKEQNPPKIQRRITRNGQGQFLTDTFSPTFTEPTDRKAFSRSKLILKNMTKTIDTQDSQLSTLKTLISPRGLRVPGKICRNNDRTFTTYSRQSM